MLQILSTLFRAGFSPSDLEGAELTKVAEILSNSFRKENGILGFGMIIPSTSILFNTLTDTYHSPQLRS